MQDEVVSNNPLFAAVSPLDALQIASYIQGGAIFTCKMECQALILCFPPIASGYASSSIFKIYREALFIHARWHGKHPFLFCSRVALKYASYLLLETASPRHPGGLLYLHARWSGKHPSFSRSRIAPGSALSSMFAMYREALFIHVA